MSLSQALNQFAQNLGRYQPHHRKPYDAVLNDGFYKNDPIEQVHEAMKTITAIRSACMVECPMWLSTRR